MGIFTGVFIIIAAIIFFISRLKLSRAKKIVWSVISVLIILSLLVYFVIQGFERGRNMYAVPEEIPEQSLK
ncbi:hypothetical protein SAMN05421786_101361 [Chryseobacterium ureilyticum]|uniref:Uncharacterized protein n=1 Tax=Chryseobacterium ureilyticum TaxID=373668 RepID=A0A1N7KBQ4_9FLAO|nr:hypothetical protein [Chryseobacterium ureilyticum]SIS58940.1 hypothetical protein SAMN05421786_101361 [Chryseobacterium ureilyticum]